MAYIYYRKLSKPSVKKNWVPKNRKYKWMFFVSFIINLGLGVVVYYGL